MDKKCLVCGKSIQNYEDFCSEECWDKYYMPPQQNTDQEEC